MTDNPNDQAWLSGSNDHSDHTSNGSNKSLATFDNHILKRAIATLDPGYFAWVMGSGIVSIGASLVGQVLISRIIFGVSIIAYATLLAAYTVRAIWFRPHFLQSLREPNIAMGYFTIVAGSNVLGFRFIIAGFPSVTLLLAIFSVLIWIVLTYGLPSFIVAGARRPIFREINGTWLIWVVATQSIAIASAGLANYEKSELFQKTLPAIAVSFWGIGVMLYLILIVMIFFRLLLVEVTAKEMGPAYWIAMGATAISARAAAGILALRGDFSSIIVGDLKPFLIGFSVVLWAFGSWWIPLLVLFGIWRYLIQKYPKDYEPRLWSVVFPVGMYTVASYSLGSVAHLDFMTTIGKVWLWVGVFTWLIVMILMAAALFKTILKH